MCLNVNSFKTAMEFLTERCDLYYWIWEKCFIRDCVIDLIVCKCKQLFHANKMFPVVVANGYR